MGGASDCFGGCRLERNLANLVGVAVIPKIHGIFVSISQDEQKRVLRQGRDKRWREWFHSHIAPQS